jgi:HD-GYP domain-containing protein (c-di-GMP phosphodiesterase class II)
MHTPAGAFSRERHDAAPRALMPDRPATRQCVVYHGDHVVVDDLAAAMSNEQRDRIQWKPAAEFVGGRRLTNAAAVLIADASLVERLTALRDSAAPVVIVAMDEAAKTALGRRVDVDLVHIESGAAQARLVVAACDLACARADGARLRHQLGRNEVEFREIFRVTTALMHEPNQPALLERIVRLGKELTEADGGGVLFLNKAADGTMELKPSVFAVDSLPEAVIPDVRFPVGTMSMVGYAAFTKKPVVVENADALPADSPFEASAAFKARYGYPARSMMAVPIMTHRSEPIGVVFFINRKTNARAKIRTDAAADRYVVPFSDRQVRLARSLASMIAVSIENTRLYAQIEHLLESFVEAAVSGIDARDPTTAGHSLRVAELTTALAEAVQRDGRGSYRGVRFTPEQMRELRFAALLHDVGKVAVREEVLVKAKKLPPLLWERVESRFALIRRTLEVEQLRRRLDAGENGAGRRPADEPDLELARQVRELDEQLDVIRAANEPTLLEEPQSTALEGIARHTYRTADGREAPYLTADELHYLQIRRGSLDERERAEVESHVSRTYLFLNGIPWTDDLKSLVTYAAGHHEKLNGVGYPKRLTADDIPVQTRLITLADMFDALTASDRPYKSAVTVERAFEIMRAEADAGELDRDLVDIMADSRAYELH